jgi:hypothetical protein
MDLRTKRTKLIGMTYFLKTRTLKTRTLLIPALLASSFLALIAVPAHAAERGSPANTAVAVSQNARYHFDVNYDIYAGGMHLIDVIMTFRQNNATYSAGMTAKPSGFFSKIVPWEGQYSTNGKIVNSSLAPILHTKTSRWGKEHDETIMHFDTRGQLTKMTDREWIHGKTPPAPKTVTPDSNLTNNAQDLVTTVVRMLYHAQQTGLNTKEACNSTHTVFDGKRRFTMQFTALGETTLQKSRYSAFSGKAQRCQIEIKPLAGFKGKKRGFYKIQEDSRKNGELPSIWLMPAWENGPPVPVRMQIKSDYGAIIVHAAKVTKQ